MYLYNGILYTCFDLIGGILQFGFAESSLIEMVEEDEVHAALYEPLQA